MKKPVLILLIVLFETVACFNEPVLYSHRGKVIVVSVGLDYANSAVQTLSGTVSDSTEVALCFQDIYLLKGIQCEVVIMEAEGECDVRSPLYPEPDNLDMIINNLDLSKNDLLIFYYSGHGLLSGSDLQLVLGKVNDESEYSLYDAGHLIERFSDLGCPCLVILDCCYSGSLVGESEYKLGEILNTFSTGKSSEISIIASSKSEQISLVSSVFTEEGIGENHSLFSISLLKQLGWVHTYSVERNLNGRKIYGYSSGVMEPMTATELFLSVVRDWKSVNQTPVISRTIMPVTVIP